MPKCKYQLKEKQTPINCKWKFVYLFNCSSLFYLKDEPNEQKKNLKNPKKLFEPVYTCNKSFVCRRGPANDQNCWSSAICLVI